MSGHLIFDAQSLKLLFYLCFVSTMHPDLPQLPAPSTSPHRKENTEPPPWTRGEPSQVPQPTLRSQLENLTRGEAPPWTRGEPSLLDKPAFPLPPR